MAWIATHHDDARPRSVTAPDAADRSGRTPPERHAARARPRSRPAGTPTPRSRDAASHSRPRTTPRHAPPATSGSWRLAGATLIAAALRNPARKPSKPLRTLIKRKMACRDPARGGAGEAFNVADADEDRVWTPFLDQDRFDSLPTGPPTTRWPTSGSCRLGRCRLGLSVFRRALHQARTVLHAAEMGLADREDRTAVAGRLRRATGLADALAARPLRKEVSSLAQTGPHRHRPRRHPRQRPGPSASRPRARGAAPGGRRAQQPGYRGRAVHLGQDRQRPRVQHLDQAWRA